MNVTFVDIFSFNKYDEIKYLLHIFVAAKKEGKNFVKLRQVSYIR